APPLVPHTTLFRSIKQIAVDGARLVMEYAEKLLGDETEFGYQYSPEIFTDTELDFALEVCEAVMDVWQPGPDREIILNLPATVERSTPSTHADRFEWMHRNLSRREYICLSAHPHNDRGTAVVVRVGRQADVLAAGEVAVHPLEAVGVRGGRGALDGGRQVQDDLPVGAGLPDVHHRLADLQREVQLGVGEDLRRVLVPELGLVAQQLLGVLHHQAGAVDGDLLDRSEERRVGHERGR